MIPINYTIAKLLNALWQDNNSFCFKIIFTECSLQKAPPIFCFYHIVLKASFSQKNSATSIRVGPLPSNTLFPFFQVENFIFHLH